MAGGEMRGDAMHLWQDGEQLQLREARHELRLQSHSELEGRRPLLHHHGHEDGHAPVRVREREEKLEGLLCGDSDVARGVAPGGEKAEEDVLGEGLEARLLRAQQVLDARHRQLAQLLVDVLDRAQHCLEAVLEVYGPDGRVTLRAEGHLLQLDERLPLAGHRGVGGHLPEGRGRGGGHERGRRGVGGNRVGGVTMERQGGVGGKSKSGGEKSNVGGEGAHLTEEGWH